MNIKNKLVSCVPEEIKKSLINNIYIIENNYDYDIVCRAKYFIVELINIFYFENDKNEVLKKIDKFVFNRKINKMLKGVLLNEYIN